MRKKIIIFIILLVVISIPVAIKVTHKPEQRETKVEETITAKEALNINENKKQDSKKDLQVKKEDEEIKTVDKTVEKDKTTISSKDEKEAKQSNSNSKQDEQKEPVVIVESKKQEIWEALGMTKDQYYNQPMYNWEKVDFKTMNECLEYGNKYKPYLDGEVLYNCHDVLSASGKFLGVMFDTEKLN